MKAIMGARSSRSGRGARVIVAFWALLLLATVGITLPAGAPAEGASQPETAAAGQLDAGGYHTCAVLVGRDVRCWGFSGDGQLGYGDRNTIGDDETPGSAGPVNLAGRTVAAISAGDFHTCAVLDDGSVRCWGYGFDGQLGYGDRDSIGDDEAPGSVGPVNLGTGRTAKAISAGGRHTCALLDDGSVRCWGSGDEGQLGYGNTNRIGADEAPGSVGPVNLGVGRTAVAISAGGAHTCAVLDDGSVRCWGYGGNGRLGYGNTSNVGDKKAPGSVGPVNLGAERTAVAISAGDFHSCAVLDNGRVRCWGYGTDGRLGYGNPTWIGDDEAPGSVAPVDLGAGRTAVAVSAGDAHTCAVLDNGSVRCWGAGANGPLGYGNTSNVGDNEAPGSVGPVDLGAGRAAVAVGVGQSHTCARLDDTSVRCWGPAGSGRLGYCNRDRIGDDETPGSVGPVDLEAPGSLCPSAQANGTGAGDGGGAFAPATGGSPIGGGGSAGSTPVTRSPGPPGRVTGLRARPASKTKIKLSFRAAGTDGSSPPAARAYLVKQSRRPIRRARDFGRAQTLCKGRCRFPLPRVGAKVILTITDLRPGSTYYYAVAALDNDSPRLGPRSKTVKATTR